MLSIIETIWEAYICGLWIVNKTITMIDYGHTTRFMHEWPCHPASAFCTSHNDATAQTASFMFRLKVKGFGLSEGCCHRNGSYYDWLE